MSAQIQLPPVVTFTLPAQHAVVILGALGNYGPFKDVQPVMTNFEQQLLAQQVFPQPASAPESSAQEPAPPDRQAVIGHINELSDL